MRPARWAYCWDSAAGVAGQALAEDPPGTGTAQSVAPTFKTIAGVNSGMRVDKNGVIANHKVNAEITTLLDYDLLAPRESPVVVLDLIDRGVNRLVGGGWLREYDDQTNLQVPCKQGHSAVVRATAHGIAIVGQFVLLTNGHTPGTTEVDHLTGSSGDFPAACLP